MVQLYSGDRWEGPFGRSHSFLGACLPAMSLGRFLKDGLVEGDPFAMWVGVCVISVVTLVYVLVRTGRRSS